MKNINRAESLEELINYRKQYNQNLEAIKKR